MKAHQNKNVIQWLITLMVIVAAIVFYRVGFRRSVPGFDEEAIKSLEQKYSEAQTKPAEAEPDASPKSAFQPPQTADLTLEQLKDRQTLSENPLYFRAVFGEQGNTSTLGILDETGGTGAGYDVAYVDENRNGDLTDDPAKNFAKYERGYRAGQTDPTFNFIGPLKDRASATYKLNIYSLRQGISMDFRDHHFFWTLDTDEWNYFFINGKVRLSSSAADALTGIPVRLAGPCKWEISAQTRDGNPMVSAALKDENGCTLRVVRRAGKIISPTLTLIQDGQVKAEEKMQFG
ncbi:hypothetical protein ACFL5Z_08620 [Planctomycetota bacterium]